MNVFEFKDYREFLKNRVQECSEKRGYLAKIAEAAGCQRSYLTLVLKKEANFTPEHAFGLTQFWEFSEDQATYFMDLVSYERCSSAPMKKHLEQRMERQRREQADFNKRYKSKAIPSIEKESIYYSHWYFSAVHVCLSIPGLDTAEAIAKRLDLPINLIQEVLQSLREIDLIQMHGGKWRPFGGPIHLPQQSVFNSINHDNWRTKAIADTQRAANRNVHYTAVQSLSRSDFEKIHSMLLKFIDQQRKTVAASVEEELAVFCCDWFAL